MSARLSLRGHVIFTFDRISSTPINHCEPVIKKPQGCLLRSLGHSEVSKAMRNPGCRLFVLFTQGDCDVLDARIRPVDDLSYADSHFRSMRKDDWSVWSGSEVRLVKEIDKFSHFTDPEVTRLTDLMDDTFGVFTNNTQRDVKTAFPSRISTERARHFSTSKTTHH